MGLLFVGGEDHQFSYLGNCAVSTDSTFRRPTYSRCGLKVTGGGGACWTNPLSVATQTFWATGRWYSNSSTNFGPTGGFFLSLNKGATQKLWVTATGNNFRLYKIDDSGASTMLVSASGTVPNNMGLIGNKVDVYVDYRTTGRFQLYLGGTLQLDYSGDVTTNSHTTLDSVSWGGFSWNYSSAGEVWSEIICSTDDTRSLSLVTLAPGGAGNATAWTGAYTDVNEVTLDDNANTSGTANQIQQFTVTTAGTVLASGNHNISAVVVSARALKGSSSGPSKMDMCVRVGSTDYFSSDISLGTTYAPVWNAWLTNPAGGNWTAAQITGTFNIGMKSIT